ncbi:MAG: hypothetical protein JJ992_03950, partial [Planctomycetes bacterium]|nr:hypothetical protein [Planctomycetota bacterium]
ITSLAKKWGEEPLTKDPPSKELLERMGFTELTPGAVVDDVELALEQPAVFYFTNEKGEIETFTVRVGSPSQGREPDDCRLTFVHAASNSRSWGGGGNPHGTSLSGVGQVTFQAEPIKDSAKYRLTIRLPSS